MSSKQVVVVLRKLSDASGWVTSCVKEVPSNIDSVESYAESITKLEKTSLANQFIEFKDAEWKYDVMPLL